MHAPPHVTITQREEKPFRTARYSAPRVRDLGQTFQQVRNLFGSDLGLLPELVRSRRDQG